MEYHYGKTIREYREKKHMTLSQLASLWPSKDTGVTLRYVSDIERGVKTIQDVQMLRKLAKLLDIPLWKLGLSEYNPFEETEQDLDRTRIPDYKLLDSFVKQLLIIKATHGMTLDTHVTYINKYLFNITQQYPRCLSDKNFMRIYSQATRLNAIKAYENTQYGKSIKLYQKMIKVAEISKDIESITLANMGAGVELMRQERYQEAEPYLIHARDYSLHSSIDKVVTALIHGMLARYYAYVDDMYHFEKFADYTANFCGGLHIGMNKSAYVYHNPSQSLEEISNGYILLNNGKKALQVLPEIEKQTMADHNTPLEMWMPLDYAQSFLCLNEIEESIKYLEAFYHKISSIVTPHIRSKIAEHLQEIEKKGYGDIHAVKHFKDGILQEEKIMH